MHHTSNIHFRDFNHTKLYTLQRYNTVVVLSAGLLRIAAVEQARIQNHLLNGACHAGDVEYITALLAGHNYSLYRVSIHRTALIVCTHSYKHSSATCSI